MIQHVALETRRSDRDACVAFFALLGFEEVEPPVALRSRAAWLERDGTQIHLLWADEPDVPPQGHVAVVAPAGTYSAVLVALRDAGHRVDERTPHWGSPRAFAWDPAGHRVEVMAFPPGDCRV